MTLRRRCCLAALFALIVFAPRVAFAQADEIQVYDGGLASVGTFNLTVHNNFTPSGIKEPAFPGAVTSHHSWNGVPEWALGVTRWFEAGLYLPLYSYDETLGYGLDGFKLRTLFAVPNADDRRFVLGSNFEFSYNAKRWDQKRYTSEIRPIIGWHFDKTDFIINPIIDTAYDGFKNLEFVPAIRIARTVKPTLQVALETYSDFGTFGDPLKGGNQVHQIYGVIDHSTKFMDIEYGVGVGLTHASDKLTLKLILSRDLNGRH